MTISAFSAGNILGSSCDILVYFTGPSDFDTSIVASYLKLVDGDSFDNLRYAIINHAEDCGGSVRLCHVPSAPTSQTQQLIVAITKRDRAKCVSEAIDVDACICKICDLIENEEVGGYTPSVAIQINSICFADSTRKFVWNSLEKLIGKLSEGKDRRVELYI